MRKRMEKKKLFLLCMVLAAFVFGIQSVSAVELINTKQKGSLTIRMQDKKKQINLTGSEFAVYQVAEVVQKDAEFSFAFTNGFENCGVDLSDLERSTLAEELQQNLAPETQKTVKTVENDGKAEFSDLMTGLYLIVQTKSIEGYHKVNPFVAAIPMKEDGVWNYEITAEPKVEETPPGETITPTPTAEVPKRNPTKIPKRTEGTSKKTLPYTGQLNWPVPVLAVVGMLLFAAGWTLRKGKRKK